MKMEAGMVLFLLLAAFCFGVVVYDSLIEPRPMEQIIDVSSIPFETCSCDSATYCLNDEDMMFINARLSANDR